MSLSSRSFASPVALVLPRTPRIGLAHTTRVRNGKNGRVQSSGQPQADDARSASSRRTYRSVVEGDIGWGRRTVRPVREGPAVSQTPQVSRQAPSRSGRRGRGRRAFASSARSRTRPEDIQWRAADGPLSGDTSANPRRTSRKRDVFGRSACPCQWWCVASSAWRNRHKRPLRYEPNLTGRGSG
jgi:hypothetical protein